MLIYEGVLVPVDGNKFHVAILKLNPSEPCCDTIMERECDTEQEANIWLDDEMSRLTDGKGIWEA